MTVRQSSRRGKALSRAVVVQAAMETADGEGLVEWRPRWSSGDLGGRVATSVVE